MGKGTLPKKCKKESSPAAGGLTLTFSLIGLQELRGWGHKHITGPAKSEASGDGCWFPWWEFEAWKELVPKRTVKRGNYKQVILRLGKCCLIPLGHH